MFLFFRNRSLKLSSPVLDGLMLVALLVAAILDDRWAALHGAGLLVVLGLLVYVAAQEAAAVWHQRGWWTSESLAVGVALCSGGFLYWWERNHSDLTLFLLSIGLMMGSLMALVSVLSALGQAVRRRNPAPVLQLIGLVLVTLGLGVLGGLLTLNAGLIWKTGFIVIGLVAWKVREVVRPPGQPMTSAPDSALLLIPNRGTITDRLIPILAIGTVLMTLYLCRLNLGLPSTPAASAASKNLTGESQQNLPPAAAH